MANPRLTTQLNEISPTGSDLSLGYECWCSTIKAKKDLSKKDMQMEKAIRKEAEDKTLHRSKVGRFLDRGFENCRVALEGVALKVEVAVRDARAAVRRGRR